MSDEVWDSLSTEEQEAHIERMLDQQRRTRNHWVLEILRFADAAAEGKLVALAVERPGPSMATTKLTVEVIFDDAGSKQ